MATTPLPRRILKAVIIVLAIPIVAVLGIAMVPDSAWRHWIITAISHKTGRETAIEGLVHVRVLRLEPSVSVDGFRMQNASWAAATPMVHVGHFEATLKISSLLHFSLVFPLVRIEAPEIHLERDANNRANWDFSPQGAKAGPSTPSAPLHLPAIQQLVLSDGTLTASDAIRKLKFNGHISIAERGKDADERALNVRGSGTLNGKPFDLRVNGGPLLQIDQGKPYDFEAAVTAADIKLNAHTKIRHPFDLGLVDSTLHLSGKDLADVYYLTGLALPNTPPYDVTGTVHRNQLKFDIDDFKGRLGKSDIEGKASIDADHPRPILKVDLKAALLNLADLAAPLGTQASAENKSDALAPPKGSGSVNPRSKLESRTRQATSKVDLQSKETGYLLPDADLQVTRVRGMDADVQFNAASIQTEKMPMKKVAFHLTLKDGRLELRPLEFTLPDGQFSGEMSIDARPPVPVTDLDMRLSKLNLAQFATKGGNDAALSGEMVGRIRLRGRGSSVHKAAAVADGDLTFVVPHGQIREAFAELTGINVAKGLGLLLTKKDQSTDIRCGVANFHATNGDLQAKTLLFDTTHVLVTGKGHINLQDEALNIELRGQPKEARLVRIRSPIDIHGTLAHPDVGLKPGPLVSQTGAAVALGTLLTPVAALLAFVDKGLAKDANCAAVIGHANATGMRVE
jgi:AsmA family protein